MVRIPRRDISRIIHYIIWKISYRSTVSKYAEQRLLETGYDAAVLAELKYKKYDNKGHEHDLAGWVMFYCKQKIWAEFKKIQKEERRYQRLCKTAQAIEYTEEIDETAYIVEKLMDRLNPQYREVVYLHLFKDMTFKEIAIKQNCTKQNIHARYKKAIEVLKEYTNLGY